VELDPLFVTWSANMTTQSPEKLIAQAAAITLAQPTFHLSIQNERGKTTVFPGVQLQGVEGSVKQPDRFRAKAKAKAVFVTVEIQVIGIAGRLWMANPIQGAKNFKERTVDARYLPLTRPDNIVQLLLKMLEDPRIDRTEKIGNQESTVVTGRFNLTRLSEVAPELTSSPIKTDRALQAEIWIDGNSVIHRLKIFGPMVTYDDNNVIRVIDFSRFGEPVAIDEPS
jgi:LppX/LprAFG-like lipoprotein